jgi:hypothetical protein
MPTREVRGILSWELAWRREFPNWALVCWWGFNSREAHKPICPFSLVLFGEKASIFCVSLHVNYVSMEVSNFK